MAQKISVRLAEPRDIVNITKLLREGYLQTMTRYAPIDEVRAYAWILNVIDTGVAAVADMDGRIIGALGASPFQPGWSKEWWLDGEFLYVLPQFRDLHLHAKLLRAVEGWADAHNAPVILSIQSGDRSLVKDRMMQMQGWSYVGGQFTREPSGQTENTDSDG